MSQNLTPEAVREEINAIMTDKSNPRYQRYWKQDKDVERYIQELYKKAYSSAKVEIGEGIEIHHKR